MQSAPPHSNLWSFEIVENTTDELSGSLFCIDINNDFHLVFSRDAGSSEISEYWIYEGAGWASDVIPFDNEFGALLVNSSGTPFLTFKSNVDNYSVNILKQQGITWTNELIDSETEALYGKIYGMVGEDDFIRLVYLYQNDYRFASNESGSWAVEHLNLGISGGQPESAVIVDEFGFSHVVVYAYNGNPNPEPDGLYYLENSTGDWTRHLIEHNIVVPMPISLNLSEDGDSLRSLYDYAGKEALTLARFPRGFE